MNHPTLKLWHYNEHAQTWEFVKECREHTAPVWLAAFQIEQPQHAYKLGYKRPSAKPNSMQERL